MHSGRHLRVFVDFYKILCNLLIPNMARYFSSHSKISICRPKLEISNMLNQWPITINRKSDISYCVVIVENLVASNPPMKQYFDADIPPSGPCRDMMQTSS